MKMNVLEKLILCSVVLMLACVSGAGAGSKPSPDETIALTLGIVL